MDQAQLGEIIFDIQPKASIMVGSKALAVQQLAALSNAGSRTLSKTAFRQHVWETESALMSDIIRPKRGSRLAKLFSKIKTFHYITFVIGHRQEAEVGRRKRGAALDRMAAARTLQAALDGSR
jgi:hypothetical protein